MPTLPTARQKKPRRRPAVTGSARHSLEQAFVSFTHVAGALENSYLELQGEVRRLRQELEETNRDLTRSLEENERMRLYLKRILKGLPCGVLVFDQQGCLRIANPEARRLLAIEPNLALQTSPQLPEALQRLRAEISLEGPAVEQEWSLEGPEGKRHFAVTRTSLPEGNGSGRESIFILRDTTEEKNLEQEREAGRRMQALAEMATLLAHEIRNPLGSLELFAGLLADATEEHTEIRNWVDHLQAGLRTISATVNNVLQFHSPPAPQLMPVNILRLLRETVDFLHPLARQRGMRIEFVNSLSEASIAAEPHRLQQVFFNLALNAFRAMSTGGGLRVSVEQSEEGTGKRLQINFEDNGTGIAPEKQEAIFEPGFTTNPGSPGLGLAVCKKIVEQHGGTIRVQSTPPEGATFYLSFPIVGAAA